MNTSNFRRSHNKIIFGVCGGIANMLGVEAIWVRLIFAVVAVFTYFLPVCAIYVVLGLVIPAADDEPRFSSRQITLLIATILISLGGFIIARQFFPWLNFGLVLAILMVGAGVMLLLRAFKK